MAWMRMPGQTWPDAAAWFLCMWVVMIPLVIGVMNLRAMAVVAAAITVERIAPAGERRAWVPPVNVLERLEYEAERKSARVLYT
jgi:hypothetical protein